MSETPATDRLALYALHNELHDRTDSCHAKCSAVVPINWAQALELALRRLPCGVRLEGEPPAPVEFRDCGLAVCVRCHVLQIADVDLPAPPLSEAEFNTQRTRHWLEESRDALKFHVDAATCEGCRNLVAQIDAFLASLAAAPGGEG